MVTLAGVLSTIIGLYTKKNVYSFSKGFVTKYVITIWFNEF